MIPITPGYLFALGRVTVIINSMAQPGAATGAAAEPPLHAVEAAPARPHSVDDVRTRLLLAAADVFAEKGYDGARVQEIARRADLTTGAIYANFSGKADLLLAAIAHVSPNELDELTAATNATDALGIVQEMGAELATRTPEEHEFLLLEALIAVRRDPDVRRVVRDHVSIRETMFAGLFDAARTRGEIDESLDSGTLARFCFAIAFGFLVFEAIDFPHPDQAAWSALVRRLVDSLRPGPDEGTAAGEDETGKNGRVTGT